MQRLINILTVMLVISGCHVGLSTISREPSRFQSVIACAQALTLDGSTDSTPNPAKKYRRSECPECKGKGYIMSGDGLFKQNCPYCVPDSEDIKGKNVGLSYCNRRDCPCEDCICPPNKCKCKVKNECNQNRVMCGADCVCENGKCKCENPKDCVNITASEINPNGCCADCICPAGRCSCTYPGECLVKRNGGKAVKICDGQSCRQYQPPAKASNLLPNAKATINQPKAQTQNKKGSSTYIYSNGERCSSSGGGWGTSSRGGRRGGFGGRGIF